MKSKIFTYGGGAGIGSYVLVMKDGRLAPDTDIAKVRGAYDAGDNLYLSLVDDSTEEALLPITGWVANDGNLHLIGRDFDDDRTYIFIFTAAEVSVEIVDGIALGDSSVVSGNSIRKVGHTLVIGNTAE